MARYEKGDIVTYWFVVCHDKDGKRIQAFSDDKDLVKFYMAFHKCKEFSLKSMEGTIESIVPIINANVNDEIVLYNIYTRDPKAKHGESKTKMIQVPMTKSEIMLLKDDTDGYLNSQIAYSYIFSTIPYLKDKYQKALDSIFLSDVIRKVVHNQMPKRLALLEIDQLILLLKLPDSKFGL